MRIATCEPPQRARAVHISYTKKRTIQPKTSPKAQTSSMPPSHDKNCELPLYNIVASIFESPLLAELAVTRDRNRAGGGSFCLYTQMSVGKWLPEGIIYANGYRSREILIPFQGQTFASRQMFINRSYQAASLFSNSMELKFHYFKQSVGGAPLGFLGASTSSTVTTGLINSQPRVVNSLSFSAKSIE